MEDQTALSPTHRPAVMVAPRAKRVIEAETTAKGCTFTLLPTLEGRWSGDETIGYGEGGPARSLSTKISYDPGDCSWQVRATSADMDCAAAVQTIRLTPVDHGKCSVEDVEGGEPGGLYEESHSGLYATITRRSTVGGLASHEVWMLAVDGTLTRTRTRYSQQGRLDSLAVTT